jgi:hypothetical protein
MADGKFFTDSTKDLIVDVLDGLKDWGLLEPVEKPVYRIVLNQVDKYADKFIPDEFDAKINEVAQLALNGQYEEAAGKGGEIIDALVNFEKVDDSIEKLVFVDGLKFIVRQILLFIEKKKN